MKKLLFFLSLVFFSLNALEIRKPVPSELQEIADVYYQAWHHAFDTLLPKLKVYKTPEHCLKTWKEFSKKIDRTVFLVACNKAKIVGVIFARPLKGMELAFGNADCMIEKLYVLPDSKKQGVGKALLQTTLHKLAKRGFKCAQLQSLSTNTNANGFYEHMGGLLVEKIKFNHHKFMHIYEFNLSDLHFS